MKLLPLAFWVGREGAVATRCPDMVTGDRNIGYEPFRGSVGLAE
jgi:hypothetical protein